MKRSHGPNSKRSRHLLSPGRIPITRLLVTFSEGERVRIAVNPTFLRGQPTTLRFNRKVGTVLGRQGRGYRVEVMDGNKTKMLVISNAHLEKVK